MNILITGSTDGIGKLAAIKLAAERHKIYLHGRNREKLDAAIKEVKERSKNEQIDGFVADFSDLEAVKNMVQEVKEKIDHLDLLINNAGVFKSGETHAKQGFEMRFTVNYLAPYLLTTELLPIIQRATDARIINLSSAAQSDISFDVIEGKRSVSENEAYAQSKLALTMWSFYLAKQLQDVVVIALNPGSLLNTKMANEAYGQHWSPAEKGADIIYELALVDEHKSHSGHYFDNDAGTYARAHSEAYNASAIQQLIDFTKKIVTI
ncbi:SDR family NAD(P)-dependent oxidoreductase [Carboxylicivirga sp. N1Y90]|uniref:SDR family NAD(P)-dependent oxidoreductase n=1 Tax=Carboxylicivirga fragile TaxID=3417571 RepID=UPI003D35764A|nr:SDR family NAD(P)-dependent oxidoreductase [Marinilabiliaceae bacterium N1Y90]